MTKKSIAEQLLLVSRLILFIGLASILIIGLSIPLIIKESIFLKNAEPDKEPEFFCGTMNLPENKVLTIEHPGKSFVEINCLACHSIRKNEKVVGPSLCGSTKHINEQIFNLLLFADPNMKIKKMRFYKKLKREYKVDFHLNYKFEVDDSTKIKIRDYIELI